MRRRRSVRRDDGITLFPFLAVLICTMGSLIVLLVVMVQQAKASAVDLSRQRAAAARTAGRATRSSNASNFVSSRKNCSGASRCCANLAARTAEQLEDRRRELSHLEDVIRELQRPTGVGWSPKPNRSKQGISLDLRPAGSAATETDGCNSSSNRPTRPSLKPVTSCSRRTFVRDCPLRRSAWDPSSSDLRRMPRRPHRAATGRNRTDRRTISRNRSRMTTPWHLPCVPNGSTWRMCCTTDDGHPYPLLVVRPEGARAYAAARAAMKSWEAEFGYELIDADLPLEYPQVDAALAELLRQAVEQSRARRRYLQAIAPARFGRVPGVLRPSHSGGFELAPGPGGSALGEDATGLQALAGTAGGQQGESGSPRGSATGSPARPTRRYHAAAPPPRAIRIEAAARGTLPLMLPQVGHANPTQPSAPSGKTNGSTVAQADASGRVPSYPARRCADPDDADEWTGRADTGPLERQRPRSVLRHGNLRQRWAQFPACRPWRRRDPRWRNLRPIASRQLQPLREARSQLGPS